MLREHYIRQLDTLRQDLLNMGNLVEQALLQAVHALQNHATSVAKAVVADDAQINTAQRSVEEQAIRLMATQQPVASDLRLLGAVIAIAGELERIGDYACGIAKRVTHLPTDSHALTPSHDLFTLANEAQQMLHTSLEAFLRQDIDIAHSLQQQEERVDELVTKVRNDLMAALRSDATQLEAAIDLLDVVRVLERVGDRATNIGERVIYMKTSATEELNP